MGYCLCVFAADFDDTTEPEELAECDVGDFCDLAFFRSSIDCNLGAGRFPTLMRLLDSDAWFPASEVRELERELQEIAAAFRELPSERMKIAFQRVAEAHTVAGSRCRCAKNASMTSIDAPPNRACDWCLGDTTAAHPGSVPFLRFTLRGNANGGPDYSTYPALWSPRTKELRPHARDDSDSFFTTSYLARRLAGWPPPMHRFC